MQHIYGKPATATVDKQRCMRSGWSRFEVAFESFYLSWHEVFSQHCNAMMLVFRRDNPQCLVAWLQCHIADVERKHLVSAHAGLSQDRKDKPLIRVAVERLDSAVEHTQVIVRDRARQADRLRLRLQILSRINGDIPRGGTSERIA